MVTTFLRPAGPLEEEKKEEKEEKEKEKEEKEEDG